MARQRKWRTYGPNWDIYLAKRYTKGVFSVLPKKDKTRANWNDIFVAQLFKNRRVK